MTIDERLEKLTERHEALTQTVELIAHEINSLLEVTTATSHAVMLLAQVAQTHESRLDRLEGK
jgi:archaellum component FlaC